MFTQRDNVSMSSAGVAEGTNANTFKTSNVLTYTLGGRGYSKAATDNIAFALLTLTPALASGALAASQVGCFFLWVDVSGNVRYEPSAVKTSSTGSAYQPGAFEWPTPRPDWTLFGAIKVSTNASGAFTPASTDLGATNQTVTYYNAVADYGVPIPY